MQPKSEKKKKIKNTIKQGVPREFPGHQWLRFQIFTAEAWVQSLVGELRSHEPGGMAPQKIK